MDVVMRMPDLATTDSPVKVVRWLVEVGRPVRRGEPLLEIETDKAVMEVESIVTGTLLSVSAGPDDLVNAGQVIATFGSDAPAAPVQGAPAAPAATAPDPRSAAPVQSAPPTDRVSFFERNRRARAARGGSAGAIPLSVPQKALAKRLSDSKRDVPHFYLQTSANAGPMSDRRAAAPGEKPVWDAFIAHAVGHALKQYPRMAYRFEGDRLVPLDTSAVNVAVDLDGELFALGLDDPAGREPEALSEEVRRGVKRLRDDPLTRVRPRAVLTVTNLGGENVEAFSAVINPPESAALAVGRVRKEVVVDRGPIEIQRRVTLTLSVDHRVVNGKYAAGFLGAIVERLESLETPGVAND